MKQSLKNALQDQLNQSLLFAPCLGINVTLKDEKHGYWTAASGFAEPKTRTPMSVDGQFYIYSITKTFTAIAILQLAQNQKLSLDEPVTNWLPDLPFPPSVTIRRLLNHTSGVPNYVSLETYLPAVEESPSVPWSYNKVLELTCHRKLDFEPGSSWRYSNTGYMLLLKVIEAVNGDTFANVLQNNIFNFLGLEKTYVATEIDTGDLVPGFSRELNSNRLMENVIPKYHPGWCATGVIVSTTSDVVQFYDSIFSEKLISAEQLGDMLQPILTDEPPSSFFRKPCYGLGVMLDPESEYGKKIGHGGGGPGYSTWVMHLTNFQGRKLTMAVFCNTSMGLYPLLSLTNDLLFVLGDA
ncbi:serine hydrolase domain-containing protein [Allocoleopsis franciscana]|uniref:Penicillin-binding protein, beta-lactamase class C n=1 Tax=Allocoleopsis franciscana PCC 7113 TaxID=1173027 RepID=K9WE40_9CYAN|nr:serine hydrolase domain-containing protein [Allocoleopsis franciscana]AFZ18650.1 penicillin-binding protein, beta-lactamase class C [Allocoleopsis franciscana PCC 7113]